MRVRNTTAGDGPYTDETKPTRGPRQARGPRRVQGASTAGGDQTKDTSATYTKTTPARRRQGDSPSAATERPARGRRRTTTPAAAAQPDMPDMAPDALPPSTAEQAAQQAAPEAAAEAASPAATELTVGAEADGLLLPEEPGTPAIEPDTGPHASLEPDEAELESDATGALPDELDEATPGGPARANRGWRRQKDRAGSPRSNALGVLIELRFADPNSSVRSYSELERHSGISREALSRYVTPRADRRRSPTVDTLAAIADAMHISLEQMCRAAAASAHGITLPSETQQHARDELIAPLCATLTDEQFSAVVELLRQMQPRVHPGS